MKQPGQECEAKDGPKGESRYIRLTRLGRVRAAKEILRDLDPSYVAWTRRHEFTMLFKILTAWEERLATGKASMHKGDITKSQAHLSQRQERT